MKPTSITALREDVITHILCLLLPKSVIRCSCVCKVWANLIHQPKFPQAYLASKKVILKLVLRRDNNVVLARLDDVSYITSNLSIPTDSVFDLNIGRVFGTLPSEYIEIVTCETTGWILAPSNSRSQPCHMYNPITGQHIVVQPPDRDDSMWHNTTMIVTRKTNQLKLLGLFYNEREYRVEGDVQTIGTNTWRRIQKVPPCAGCPISVKGRSHWLHSSEAVINAFDAEDEVFEVIQMPQGLKELLWAALGLLDGNLCLTTRNHEWAVWVMNNYGIQDSWTKMFVVSNVRKKQPSTTSPNERILMLADCRCCNGKEYLTLISIAGSTSRSCIRKLLYC